MRRRIFLALPPILAWLAIERLAMSADDFSGPGVVLREARQAAESLPGGISGYRIKDEVLRDIIVTQAGAGEISDALKTIEKINRGPFPEVTCEIEGWVAIASAQVRQGYREQGLGTFQRAMIAVGRLPSEGGGRLGPLAQIASAQAGVGEKKSARMTIDLMAALANNLPLSPSPNIMGFNKALALDLIATAQSKIGDRADADENWRNAITAADAIQDVYYKAGSLIVIAGNLACHGTLSKALRLLDHIKSPAFEAGNKANVLSGIALSLEKGNDARGSMYVASKILDPHVRSRTLIEIGRLRAGAGKRGAAFAAVASATRAADATPGLIQRGLSLAQASLLQSELDDKASARLTAGRAFDCSNQAERVKSMLGALLRPFTGGGVGGRDPTPVALLAQIALARAKAGDSGGSLVTLLRARQAADAIEEPSTRFMAIREVCASMIHMGMIAQAVELSAQIPDSRNGIKDDLRKMVVLARAEAGDLEGLLRTTVADKEINGDTVNSSVNAEAKFHAEVSQDVARRLAAKGDTAGAAAWVEKQKFALSRSRSLLGRAQGLLEHRKLVKNANP